MGKLGGKERQRRGKSKETGILIDIGNSEGEGSTPSFPDGTLRVSINECSVNTQ